MIEVVLGFEEDVLRLNCGYAPQSGRKTVFYDQLKSEWHMHSADDLVMCMGDINGHMSRHGFDGVHGGYHVS